MDAEARALLWRCRRGMKELDVLFQRYAATALPGADAAERRLLAYLLENPDPELAGYFLGGVVPPDPALAALVNRIRGWGAWEVPETPDGLASTHENSA